MFDHAAYFIDKVLPWPAEGETAFINLHWKNSRLGPDGKPTWTGRACRTPQEFLGALSWVSRLSDAQDIYVCMSSQFTAKNVVSKTGHSYLLATRSAHNALKMRSFFIDVDVKEEPKGYPDTNTALNALQQFMQVMGLPLPTAMVASGSGGFHVHWALAEAVPIAQWQPLAHALARATEAHGLRCDRGCTVDAARILRIPDTKNYKSDPPNPTALLSLGEHVTLELMMSVLGAYMGQPVPTFTPGMDPGVITPRFTPTGNDELSAGIGEAPPVYIDEIAKQCAFVNEAIQTGGANYDNQAWFNTLAIATFVVDGHNQAHRMSCGHATYNPAETTETFNRLARGQIEKNTGWPKCSKIALSYAGCKSCPLYTADKTPLHYGYASVQAQAMVQAANAVPGAQTLPSPYFQTPEGMVYAQIVGEDGQAMNAPVLPYPMLDVWLQDNPWVLHFKTNIAGRKIPIEVPFDLLSPTDGVSKVFGKQGIMLKDKAKPIAKEFFVSFIQKLQQSRELVVSSSPFGWSEVNGKTEGFTYAGRVWGKDIDRPAAAPDPAIAQQYMPRGDIGPWIEAAQIITDQQRPELEAILASSFAAPLMFFTGHDGALLNAYSEESGIGKTTAMRIALAAWGHPKLAMQGLSDTANSVIGKMSKTKVLPVFWDELKSEMQVKNLVNLVFTITGGIEKSRMRQDTTLRDRGTWQTLMVTACNDSLIDPMQRATSGTNAGIFRLFEYKVTRGKQGQIAQGEVTRKVAELERNFGNAGLVYAQFIGANHERVKKETAELFDRVANATNAENDERFWIATITVIIAGAMYANELGLTQFHIPQLSHFLLAVLQSMRNEIKDSPVDMHNTMSVSTILSQFIKAMQARHTLLTNKIHTGAGKPPVGSVIVKCNPDKLDGIYVQIGLEDKKMRISSTYFSKWMKEHEYSRHAFTRALIDEFGMKKINGKLGSGTPYATPMEYVMEIDMSDPRLAGFIEV